MSFGENSGAPRLQWPARKDPKPLKMWQVPLEIAFLWLGYTVRCIFLFTALVVAGRVGVPQNGDGAPSERNTDEHLQVRTSPVDA
jgi:hypothetical protein